MLAGCERQCLSRFMKAKERSGMCLPAKLMDSLRCLMRMQSSIASAISLGETPNDMMVLCEYTRGCPSTRLCLRRVQTVPHHAKPFSTPRKRVNHSQRAAPLLDQVRNARKSMCMVAYFTRTVVHPIGREGTACLVGAIEGSG